MANELAYSDVTGLTVTADVYSPGGTVIQSGVSMAEASSTGTYWATMPAASAQVVHVDYKVSSVKWAAEEFYWDGTNRLDLEDALTATGFSTHSAADVWTATTRTLTSAALSAADIWSYATRVLTASGLTTEQGTQLDELHRLNGLDSGNPVTMPKVAGNLTTGAIDVTVVDNGDSHTLTRQ